MTRCSTYLWKKVREPISCSHLGEEIERTTASPEPAEIHAPDESRGFVDCYAMRNGARLNRMTDIVKAIWPRTQAVLHALAESMATDAPGLAWTVGHSSNEAIPLIGSLSFLRDSQGDEFAIVVEVQRSNAQFFVESDACAEGGVLIAAGPSAVIGVSDSQEAAEAKAEVWLREFETFLRERREVFVAELGKI